MHVEVWKGEPGVVGFVIDESCARAWVRRVPGDAFGGRR